MVEPGLGKRSADSSHSFLSLCCTTQPLVGEIRSGKPHHTWQSLRTVLKARSSARIKYNSKLLLHSDYCCNLLHPRAHVNSIPSALHRATRQSQLRSHSDYVRALLKPLTCSESQSLTGICKPWPLHLHTLAPATSLTSTFNSFHSSPHSFCLGTQDPCFSSDLPDRI